MLCVNQSLTKSSITNNLPTLGVLYSVNYSHTLLEGLVTSEGGDPVLTKAKVPRLIFNPRFKPHGNFYGKWNPAVEKCTK